MLFARWTFRIAGIYGILVLAPHYFLEGAIGRDMPPAITHPEFYYGFLGLALAWQAAFLVLARDPARFRAMMIPAILEKISFAVPAFILIAGGRSPALVAVGASIDLVLASFFLAAYLKTKPAL